MALQKQKSPSLNTSRYKRGQRVIVNFGFYQEDMDRLTRLVGKLELNQSQVIREALKCLSTKKGK